MDFIQKIRIEDIAEKHACQLIKNGANIEALTGINEINRVRRGDICFVDAPKYYKKTLKSKASCVIIPEEVDFAHNKTLLINSNPFQVYNSIAKDEGDKHLLNENKIDDTAKVHSSVYIGKNVQIGYNTEIQAHVFIGDNVTIGNNVKIQSGTKIGTDAFYLHKSKTKEYKSWYSCGKVIIEDNVHIGANCTINQAVSDVTKIGEGTHVDCLVHIAHGVMIGKHCLIAAQVGISGKTAIGNYVSIYGQVGITQNLIIGDNVIIYAQSGVANNLKSDGVYFGSPALPMKEKIKEIRALRRLQK